MLIGNDRMPYRCFVKWDKRQRILRLGRLVWRRGLPGKPGGGYTAKLSLALSPRVFSSAKEYAGFIVTLFGVRIHYRRAYGGWIT